MTPHVTQRATFDEIDAIIMDRAHHYGPPEENFERMARGYEVILELP